MSHLLIYGNAYAQIIRNGRGDVLGLYPLMPDKVRVDRDQRNRLVYIYSRYDEANPNLKQQGDIVLQAADVLHIPGLGYDGLVGYSSIALAKNAIGISLACEDYGSTFSPTVPVHPVCWNIRESSKIQSVCGMLGSVPMVVPTRIIPQFWKRA